MEALRSRDVAVLAGVVAEVVAASDLGELRAAIPTQLQRLVGCDVTSYNEVGPPPAPGERRELHVEADPPEMLADRAIVKSFAARIHQNPLLAHFQRTGESATLRMSDHISRQALHRLELYDEVYRQLGVEHQLALTLPLGGAVVGITASRGTRDFDERERQLIAALGPFVAAALANLRARARLDAMLAALDHAQGPVTAILLVQDGSLCPGDARGEHWLAALARGAPPSLQHLTRWAAHGRRAGVGAQLQPSPPAAPTWVRDAAGAPRRARYLGPAGAGPAVILVEEVPGSAVTDSAAAADGTAAAAETAAADGAAVAAGATAADGQLTARQLQVLELVATGATNEEVGASLTISPRTVAHHLEEIYRRLGVTSRTGAARRLSELRDGR